jgi:hypothetical protein
MDLRGVADTGVLFEPVLTLLFCVCTCRTVYTCRPAVVHGQSGYLHGRVDGAEGYRGWAPRRVVWRGGSHPSPDEDHSCDELFGRSQWGGGRTLSVCRPDLRPGLHADPPSSSSACAQGGFGGIGWRPHETSPGGAQVYAGARPCHRSTLLIPLPMHNRHADPRWPPSYLGLVERHLRLSSPSGQVADVVRSGTREVICMVVVSASWCAYGRFYTSWRAVKSM